MSDTENLADLRRAVACIAAGQCPATQGGVINCVLPVGHGDHGHHPDLTGFDPTDPTNAEMYWDAPTVLPEWPDDQTPL